MPTYFYVFLICGLLGQPLLYLAVYWFIQFTKLLKERFPDVYEQNKKDLVIKRNFFSVFTNKDFKDLCDDELNSLVTKIKVGLVLSLLCTITCVGGFAYVFSTQQ